MKSKLDDVNIKKLTLAAEMYYIYDLSQKEIAERLGISRPWVSKLLKRAKETGIVKIEIDSPITGTPKLEQKLKEQYRIDHVSVIQPMVNGDYTNINMAAAHYLVSHIKRQDTIGVSWGMSIARTIDYVIDMDLPDVSIVPIVGGAGSEADCLSNVCANRLADVLGAKCQLLHAYACCFDQNEFHAIMSNPMVKEVIDIGENCDIALVGIGDIEHSRIIEYDFVREKDREDIERYGVVGDIAFRFIDKGGEIADMDFNKRVVGCDLVKIRKHAREIIAISYGVKKAEVIKAALKGGLINTLFTDCATAEKLINDY